MSRRKRKLPAGQFSKCENKHELLKQGILENVWWCFIELEGGRAFLKQQHPPKSHLVRKVKSFFVADKGPWGEIIIPDGGGTEPCWMPHVGDPPFDMGVWDGADPLCRGNGKTDIWCRMWLEPFELRLLCGCETLENVQSLTVAQILEVTNWNVRPLANLIWEYMGVGKIYLNLCHLVGYSSKDVPKGYTATLSFPFGGKYPPEEGWTTQVCSTFTDYKFSWSFELALDFHPSLVEGLPSSRKRMRQRSKDSDTEVAPMEL